MMSSERRAEVNRQNATRSTGPKTAEGKANSRRNALKHGLRGSGAVLPEDDRNALTKEVAAWEAHFEPDDPISRALVRRAALAAVRLERCAREEAARLDERKRHAARRWHLARTRDVEALAASLPTDPCRIVPALRETPEGCSWLMARWRLLRVALTGRGHWTLDEFAQALHLLGRSEQSHRRELAACRVSAAHLAAQSGRSAEAAAAEGLLSAEQGRDWLDRRSLLELRRLRDCRNALKDDRKRDLETASDRVLFDASPGASLMRRYESAAMSDLNRCIGLLSKSRSQDEPKPSRARSPRSEPETTIEAGIEPTPRPARERRKPAPLAEIKPIPVAIKPPEKAIALEVVAMPNEAKPGRGRRTARGGAIVLAFLLGAMTPAAIGAIPGPRIAALAVRCPSEPHENTRSERSDGPTLPILAVGSRAPGIGDVRDRAGRPGKTIQAAMREGESGQDGAGESPSRRQGGRPKL